MAAEVSAPGFYQKSYCKKEKKKEKLDTCCWDYIAPVKDVLLLPPAHFHVRQWCIAIAGHPQSFACDTHLCISLFYIRPSSFSFLAVSTWFIHTTGTKENEAAVP